MTDHSKLCDEELVLLYIKTRDESLLSSLMVRYHNLITHSAAQLFLAGAEREDLIQEGRMGLFHALNSYDPEKNDSFAPFARLCIQRALLKAVEASNRKKHAPLNTSVPLEIDSKDGATLPEETKVSSPEDIMLDVMETNEVFSEIEESLSPAEMDVLLYLIEGYSYKQIANILNREAKSIDNAIQRIRNKVSSIMKERENV